MLRGRCQQRCLLSFSSPRKVCSLMESRIYQTACIRPARNTFMLVAQRLARSGWLVAQQYAKLVHNRLQAADPKQPGAT